MRNLGEQSKKKKNPGMMNPAPFMKDIDELIDEFVEDDLTTFEDMKRVWLSRKFSYIYEAIPTKNINLPFFIQSLYAHVIGHMVSSYSLSRRLGGLYCLYCLHEIQPFKPMFRIYISLQELGKFRDLVVEAKDKGIEVALVVAKQMLDKHMFIFGAVDLNEASATETVNQLTQLQNARVRFAYDKLISVTKIEEFIHLDMGDKVDLDSVHKMSIEYAEAKKRAIRGAREIMEIEDIKHISEEKELLGDKMEKVKEEWDSQRLEFYDKTKLDCLPTPKPKLLKNGDDGNNEDDDGFDELERLLV